MKSAGCKSGVKRGRSTEAWKIPSFLRKGSKVEACSKEIGFENSWFPATVVEPPKAPKCKPSDSIQHLRRIAKLQYDHMLDERTGELLVKAVHCSQIRPPPLPTPTTEPLEEYDLVDAFHSDIWWTGFVVRIDGDRYIVAFKNPLDVLEVGREQLRAHLDWVGSEWVKPPKEVPSTSFFCLASMVECNFDQDKPGTIWLPAVSLGPVGNEYYLVKYNNSEGHDETIRLHGKHLRPCPPLLEKSFGLQDKVEALNGSFWYVGFITASLNSNKYTVTLENDKKEMNFNHTDLRHHLDWINFEWVTNLKQNIQEDIAETESNAIICAEKRAMEESLSEPAGQESLGQNGSAHKEFETAGMLVDPKEVVDLYAEQSCQPPIENCETTVISCLTNRMSENPETQAPNLRTTEEIGNNNNDEAVVTFVNEAVVTFVNGATDEQALGNDSSGDQTLILQVEETHLSNIGNVGPKLPFVKRSKVWKILQSMAVFLKLPQNPHFLPLLNHPANYREGWAIGHMVNFSNLTEAISKLKEEDFSEKIDDILKELAEFEELGFDVRAVLDCLEEMQVTRVESEKLGVELQGVISEIADSADEITKTNEKVAEITNEMVKIKRKQEELMSENEEKHSKMVKLTSEIDIRNARFSCAAESIRCLFRAP